jgi:peptidoglycan/LPS O-acetylase OafA/YrhL
MLQQKSYGDTDFITGLRAVAMFMVILIHSGGAGLRELGGFGNNFVDVGRTGVYIFFVISGFSVAQSYLCSQGFIPYFLKRMFRIIPLYYTVWLIVAGVSYALGLQGSFISGQPYVLKYILLALGYILYLDSASSRGFLGVE